MPFTFPLAITGLDLISSAARLAGFLASGETLQGNEPHDCLLMAQQMLDTWQADGLKIFAEAVNTFPLTPGTQAYTLGPDVLSPNFTMTRPPKIQRLGLLMTATNPVAPPERPLNILTYEEWSRIPVKNTAGSFPISCYVEYGYPDISMQFWQIPGTACSVVVYAWQAISTFPDFATPVIFPPAYLEAIKYNLGIRMAAEFKTQPDPLVIEIARSSLATVKEINLPAPVLIGDGGLTPSPRAAYYDWRSDTYIGR